jgi:hypothetical protein
MGNKSEERTAKSEQQKAEGQRPNARSEKKKKENKSSGGRQPMEVLPSKEEKALFEWKALERPFQKKDKEFWTTVLSVLGLVCLILFFVKEWFLIATLIAFLFLYYVLLTVKPEKRKYKITNKGVYISPSERINWDLLHRFWISEKWGHQMVNFGTWLKFPRVVSLVIPEEEKKELVETLEKYLPQEETSPQFLDKFSTWVTNKLPLEKEEKKKS